MIFSLHKELDSLQFVMMVNERKMDLIQMRFWDSNTKSGKLITRDYLRADIIGWLRNQPPISVFEQVYRGFHYRQSLFSSHPNLYHAIPISNTSATSHIPMRLNSVNFFI